MSNDQINTIYCDRKNNSFHEICRLSIRKHNKDLYFVDKSNPIFHISIHKDGKVFLSSQSNNKQFESILLLAFDWDEIDNEVNYEKPFLFYQPSDLRNYPVISYDKQKGLRVVIDKMNSENLLIKYFLISDNVEKLLIRETDSKFQLEKVELKSPTGKIETQNVEIIPPILHYNNHKIRYDIDRINYSFDSDRKHKFLYLCQPTKEMNIVDFISENTFYFDSSIIRRVGFQILNYKYKNTSITMIVY